MNPDTHPSLLRCPVCNLIAVRPQEAHPDEVILCPGHSRPMVPLTWQQAAEYYQGMARVNSSQALIAARRMADAEQMAAQLQERWDNRQFREDCLQEELEQLREWKSGPLGAFAVRMARVGLDGIPPRTDGIHPILRELEEARTRGNRLLVNQLAAEAGLALIELIREHGDPDA